VRGDAHLLDPQMEMVEQARRSSSSIRGRLGGPILDVKRASGRRVVRLGVEGDATLPWLAGLDGVSVVRAGEDYTELDVRGRDPQSILRAAIDRGEQVTQFLIADPSIEQVFIEHVGRPPSDDHHLAEAGIRLPPFWVA
jgi:ABC-type uncharacterized transport system ATPase subunit